MMVMMMMMAMIMAMPMKDRNGLLLFFFFYFLMCLCICVCASNEVDLLLSQLFHTSKMQFYHCMVSMFVHVFVIAGICAHRRVEGSFCAQEESRC